MSKTIHTFNQITNEEMPSKGGKGSSLAKLYQAGFPVPDGFVISPSAFSDDELQPEAWLEVQALVNRFREKVSICPTTSICLKQKDFVINTARSLSPMRSKPESDVPESFGQ